MVAGRGPAYWPRTPTRERVATGTVATRGATFAQGRFLATQSSDVLRCGAKLPGGLAGVGEPLPWTSRP